MKDIKAEFSIFYKGKIDLIFKQTNLLPNCLDKHFKQQFLKILDNYKTGISDKNLQQAFKKVDEIKDITSRSVVKMVENTKETDVLLQTSNEIKMLSRDFEKNAQEMKNIQQR